MQSLWSRSAQTRACRCGPCLHAANIVARRTTTAASKRRLKASDVFTACYSAMFATAALADMKMKEKRRNRWDQLIEEVKTGKEVTTPPDFEVRRVMSHDSKRNDSNETPSSSIIEAYEHSIRTSRTRQDIWEALRLGAPPPEFEVRRVSSGDSVVMPLQVRRVAPANWLREKTKEETFDIPSWSMIDAFEHSSSTSQTGRKTLETLSSIPSINGTATPLNGQLGRLESHLKQTREYEAAGSTLECLDAADSDHRQPKTIVHLDKMQDMVANLVTRLLLATKSSRTNNDTQLVIENSLKDLDRRRASIAQRPEAFLSSMTQLPRYTFPESEDIMQEQRKLNCAIDANLKPKYAEQASIDLLVAKVCYNLMVSSAPPNISTYNVLIKRLTLLQQHNLAGVVVDSLLHHSRLKPNARTLSAILDHYTATRNLEGFRRTVRQMRGVEKGLRLKRRDLSTVLYLDHTNWARAAKIIHRDGHLYEKAHRNAEVFASLIRGALELFGWKRAITYLKIAIREGCHVGAEILGQLVDSCLTQPGERARLVLISALSSQWRHAIDCEAGLDYDADIRQHVYRLLQSTAMGVKLVETQKQLPNLISLSPFNRMIRHLYMEEIRDAMAELGDRAAAAQNIVTSAMNAATANSSDLPVAERARNQNQMEPLENLANCLEEFETGVIVDICGDLPTKYQLSYIDAASANPGMSFMARLETVFDLCRDSFADPIGLGIVVNKDINEVVLYSSSSQLSPASELVELDDDWTKEYEEICPLQSEQSALEAISIPYMARDSLAATTETEPTLQHSSQKPIETILAAKTWKKHSLSIPPPLPRLGYGDRVKVPLGPYPDIGRVAAPDLRQAVA